MAVIVKTVLEQLLNEQNNWQLKLLKNWPTLVNSLKTQVHLLKIYNDLLVIGVSDSCWLQELYFLSPLLIEKINQIIEQPRIKKLHFKTLAIPPNKKKKIKQEMAPLIKMRELAPQEKKILATIKDDQMQQYLKEYLLRCYNNRSF